MKRPLLPWQLRLVAVALPAIALFLFEDLRHTWLSQSLPSVEGNLIAALVVALGAWGYVHLLTGVMERAGQELARARARAAVLQERGRIAGDLHDHVAQALFLLGHRLAQSDAPGDLQELVQKTLQEVRRDIGELRALTSGSFTQELEALCAELEDRFGLELDVRLEAEGWQLAAPAQEQALGVAREALTNVAKHARTRRASLSLQSAGTGCVLVVEDHGRGFDPAAASGFGLLLMQERAELAGGSLRLVTRPGAGCRVELRWGGKGP